MTITAISTLVPLLLGLFFPTVYATKYGVQITKPIIKHAIGDPAIQTSVTQIYVIFFGAAALTGAAFPVSGIFHIAYTLTPLPISAAAIFGAAAGLAAIGDFHLIDAMRQYIPGLPSDSAVAAAGPPPVAATPPSV